MVLIFTLKKKKPSCNNLVCYFLSLPGTYFPLVPYPSHSPLPVLYCPLTCIGSQGFRNLTLLPLSPACLGKITGSNGAIDPAWCG